MSSQFSGGCLCGFVRYAVSGEPQIVAYCHCGMCRRASGAPVTAWAVYEQSQFRLTSGEPAMYASSAHGTRSFCPRCGAPLTFRSTERPGVVDVAAGSLDEPERLSPAVHVWYARHLPWLRIDDDLPRIDAMPGGG